MEPLIDDRHADAALDGWAAFESRRQPAQWNRWDMVGAIVAVVGAVIMAGVL
jgi:drug/metabolite transporter superfamily protein YnfA